jgi:hypothetical protein
MTEGDKYEFKRRVIHLHHFDGMNYTKLMNKIVSLLISLKNYYILNPNLSGLLEPQEDESTTIKIERLKREKK